jgi:hypothetical protein
LIEETTVEDSSELEKLITEGLGIDFRDHFAIQNWWFSTYTALAPFPEEQYRFRDVFISDFGTPEKQIERGIEILNDVVDCLIPPPSCASM